MNNHTDTHAINADNSRARRRRKLLSITAGGLVLGVGAVVTLASWTDTEVAAGDFAAGRFALESSLDGTNFTDHTPPAEPLTLSFGSLAQNLSPNEEASAVYALRLDQASTYTAEVAGTVTASGSAADNLSYTIERVSDIAGGTPIGSPLVSDEPVSAGTAHDNLFGLTSTSDVVYLKVTVAADDSLGQAETADVTWTLTGTSGESLS